MANVMQGLKRGAYGVYYGCWAMVFYVSPFFAGFLCIMSYVASPDPGAPNFDTFHSFYKDYVKATALFVMAAAVLLDSVEGFHKGPVMFLAMTVISALMVNHLGNSMWIHYEATFLAVAVIALFAVYGYLSLVASGQAQERQQVLATNSGESQHAPPANDAIRYKAVPARLNFQRVVGMTAIKARMLEAGREVVASRNMQGGRNGILLSGKPGNGKTMLAEALAGELRLPIIVVSFGEVVSRYIGAIPENVKIAFDNAVAQAPCVLFLDEIDSLLQDRDKANATDEAPRITNTLLTELVNMRHRGVVVVAATNRIEKLDAAGIREGRFDFKMEVPPPDAEARQYLIHTKVAHAIHMDSIATAVRRWEGFSGARITAIVEEANRKLPKGQVMTYDHLKTALRTLQGRKGNIPENTPTLDQLTLGEQERKALAGLAVRMTRMEEIEAMGGTVPRGVLFFGPPGTGKTLAARVLAKTADWAFLSVSGMDLISEPSKIEKLVEDASDLRPCVVFIDEADDVFRDRRMSNNPMVTNKLLAALDGAGGQTPDILFIAATNHPEDMDDAALRGGRFTEKVEFSVPNAETLGQFIQKWMIEKRVVLDRNLPPQQIVTMIQGNSIANVKEILQMAINNAIASLEPGASQVAINAGDLAMAIRAVAKT